MLSFKMKKILCGLIFCLLAYVLICFNKAVLPATKYDETSPTNEIATTKILKNKIIHKRNLSINHTSTADKWIIVTSINKPTKQIAKLAKEREFKLLVIADLKTDQNWFYENVTFLNVSQQKKLKYKSLATTPFNSYTRKNIGYLYAIQHGARFIYDTDDDNQPIIDLMSYFDFEPFKYELEYNCKSPLVVNPYAHFGQPTIWPRGYPLSEIEKKNHNNYDCIKKATSIVQQSVVNGDPDVDAIFRLTKSLDHQRIDIEFDDYSPSVKIPMYRITPYNSQNTFFHYKAFWALYLPYTVTIRITDIWRSYWTQRLLWLLDSTVSFYGPNAYQLRNAHSYLKDFKEESTMYLHTEKFIQMLYKWKCRQKTFYKCVIDLSIKMADEGYWHKKEVQAIKNWLDDLDSIDYEEPKIVNFNYENSNEHFDFTKENPQICEIEHKNEKKKFSVKYTPNFQKSLDFKNYFSNGLQLNVNSQFEAIEYFENYCKNDLNLTYSSQFMSLGSSNKSSTLLIAFNKPPELENILFLTNYYKSFFGNIVFCGHKFNESLKENTSRHFKKFDSYTFIELSDTESGNYDCVSKMIKMNYRTSGVLSTSDDTLLKYWDIDSFDGDKILFTQNCDNSSNSSTNLQALNSSYIFLKKAVKNTKDIDKTGLEIILNNMNKNMAACDINNAKLFYLPKKYFNAFNYLAKFYHENNILYKVPIPNILLALKSDENSKLINDRSIWLLKSKQMSNRKFICQSFIQKKIDYESKK